MTAVAEVLPFAADDAGIWLASGRDTLDPQIGPWCSAAIPADSTVQFEVESLLAYHGVDVASPYTVAPLPGQVRVLHSPSWREDGRIVLTYFALLDVDGPVIARWPEALPVGVALATRLGPARPHGPAVEPVVDYGHVILHALRHVRYLVSVAMREVEIAADPADAQDAEIAAALVGHPYWYRHLEPLAPVLAGMYRKRVA